MKHIKPFNEDITSFNFEEELQDFCETNLAYILDDGGEIEVVENNKGFYLIKIKADPSFDSQYIPDPDTRANFDRWNWNDIKDHIIPFLTRLNNKYELSRQLFINTSMFFPTTKIINDFSKGDIRFFIIYNTEELASTSFYSYTTDLVKNVISEKTRYNFDSFKIYEICIVIEGYKKQNEIPKPEKGMLTKLKSFFK
jgi:hypothetical protein